MKHVENTSFPPPDVLKWEERKRGKQLRRKVKAKKSVIKKGLAIPIQRFVAGNSVRCVICDLEPKLQYGDVFSCVNVSGFNS